MTIFIDKYNIHQLYTVPRLPVFRFTVY